MEKCSGATIAQSDPKNLFFGLQVAKITFIYFFGKKLIFFLNRFFGCSKIFECFFKNMFLKALEKKQFKVAKYGHSAFQRCFKCPKI